MNKSVLLYAFFLLILINVASAVYYTGASCDAACGVVATSYNITLTNGVGSGFYALESDNVNFDWALVSATQGINAVIDSAGNMQFGRANADTVAGSTPYPGNNTANLNISFTNPVTGANVSYRFYETYFVTDVTANFSYRSYDYSKNSTSAGAAFQSDRMYNSTSLLDPANSFTDADDTGGVNARIYNQTSNWTLVITWNQTLTTDFDYQATGTGTSMTSAIARSSEITAGSHLIKYYKFTALNTSAATTDQKVLTVANAVKNDITYGDNTGPDWYFSQSGSDSNDCSLGSPCQTISKLNSLQIEAGDTIYFNRGDTWNIHDLDPILVNGSSGAGYTTYTAYGTGAQPTFINVINASASNNWTQVTGNIWVTNFSMSTSSVGMVFLGSDYTNIGFYRYNYADLTAAKDFWYNTSNSKLYFYSTTRPDSAYTTVLIATRTDHIYDESISYVHINDLHFNKGGRHALDLRGADNVILSNLTVSYIGGALQTGSTRYGNGIQIYKGATNVLVTDCNVSEIYDAALTAQSSSSEGAVNFTNVTFRNNLVYTSAYGFEYFNSVATSRTTNLNLSYNTFADMGRGAYDAQRDLSGSTEARTILLTNTPQNTTGISIMNNIFSNSSGREVNLAKGDTTAWKAAWPTMDYNLYSYGGSVTMIYWNNSYYTTPALLYAATGQEQHAIYGPPNFQSVPGRVFRPINSYACRGGSGATDIGAVGCDIYSIGENYNISTYALNADETRVNLTLQSHGGMIYFFQFNMTGITNRIINFSILNAQENSFYDTTTTTNVVYSCDNGATWTRITTYQWDDTNNYYHFWTNFTTCTEARIATVFPVQYSEINNYLTSLNSTNTYAKINHTAVTATGKYVYTMRITEPTISDSSKRKIYVIAGQHGNSEPHGVYFARGVIEYLSSSRGNASLIRNNTVWYITPMANSEAYSSGNSKYNANGYDLNDHWNSSTITEINQIRSFVTNSSTAQKWDLMFDMHGFGDNTNIDTVNSYSASAINSSNYVLSEAVMANISARTRLDYNVETSLALDNARGYFLNNLSVVGLTPEPAVHNATWTVSEMNLTGQAFGEIVKDVYNITTTLTASATTTYYFSNSGSDSSDCATPATACQSLTKLNSLTVTPGSYILFKKGDLWRISEGEYINIHEGNSTHYVTYSSYGDDSTNAYMHTTKPAFTTANFSNSTSHWTNMGGNIWRFHVWDTDRSMDVAQVVFNSTRANYLVEGYKEYNYASLNSQGEFYSNWTNSTGGASSTATRYLYVYSTSNPATAYQAGIEVVYNYVVLNDYLTDYDATYDRKTYYIWENSSFIRAGKAAVDTDGHHIIFRNNDVKKIGGGSCGGGCTGNQQWGNGFQAWQQAYEIEVYNNYFEDIIDAAMTSQGTSATSWTAYNQRFINNTVDRAGYGFELMHSSSTASAKNITVLHNTFYMSDAGSFANQRQNETDQTSYPRCLRVGGMYNTVNFTFKDNICFDSSAYIYGFTQSPINNFTAQYFMDYNYLYKGEWGITGYNFSYVVPDFGWGASQKRNCTDWQSVSGKDANSVCASGAEIFTDTSTNNFVPLPGAGVCGAASDGGDIGAEECSGDFLYVNNSHSSCSDAYTRTQALSDETPWCSIDAADGKVLGGDTIKVFRGDYNGEILLDNMVLSGDISIQNLGGQVNLTRYDNAFNYSTNQMWTNLSTASSNLWRTSSGYPDVDEYAVVYLSNGTMFFIYDDFANFNSSNNTYDYSSYSDNAANIIYIRTSDLTFNPNATALYVFGDGYSVVGVSNVTGGSVHFDGFTIKYPKWAFYGIDSQHFIVSNSSVIGGIRAFYVKDSENMSHTVVNNNFTGYFDPAWKWYDIHYGDGAFMDTMGIYVRTTTGTAVITNNYISGYSNGIHYSGG